MINENDTVVNDEIKFGDNDTLGALVANLVEADALVILTDQRGLYSADPRKDPQARFIDEADAGDPALEPMAGGAGSSHRPRRHDHQGAGRQARGRQRRQHRDRLGPRARRAAAPGRRRGHRHARWSPARRSWRRASSGWPTTCSCAARWSSTPARCAKLRDEGKSLLPIGVVEVQGEFQRGDVIAVRSAGRRGDRARPGQLLAAAEARLIARKPSSRDRAPARLRRRARADPPRQPRARPEREPALDARRRLSRRPGAARRPAARRRRGGVEPLSSRCCGAHAGAQVAVVVVARAAGSAPARSAPSGRRRA